jgi:NAD+ synthetase
MKIMPAPSSLTLALAQINVTVGDVAGNAARIIAAAQQAAAQGAGLVLYPEMALTGYPPEDLVLMPAFLTQCHRALKRIGEETQTSGVALILGAPWEEAGRIYNASVLIEAGVVTPIRTKHDLPNYGVFDEKRIFAEGEAPRVLSWRGLRLGVLICEEVWDTELPKQLAAQGAEMLLVQNASPYHIGKGRERRIVVAAAARATGLPVVYLNLVGGQDELVFDGGSYAVDATGAEVARLKSFDEELALTRWECRVPPLTSPPASHSLPPLAGGAGGGNGAAGAGASSNVPSLTSPPLAGGITREALAGGITREALAGGIKESASWRCVSAPLAAAMPDLETLYQALVLGLRDYVTKNRFPGVVLGLSGGVDSGLTAAIAVDALGADKVLGVKLPSPITSRESHEDAEALAKNLGIRLESVPIAPLMAATGAALADLFKGRAADTTEENIQARLRGLILMALSNKFGHMVLTTGNKSEMSVGYATLYGDMCGGFSVLKDVYKTTVYKLCEWRNARGGEAIPARMITKPPTAELREGQKDEDSLPPYPLLDAMLRGLIERRLGVAELVAEGMDEALITKVAGMVIGAEYKRRQSAPGVKVTPMAFGRDRRWPITNGWRYS